MERRMTRMLAAGLVGGAALFLLACPPQVVNIAAVLPLTGEHSAYGQSIKRGIELAYADIKADANFGKPALGELVMLDTASDPKKAAELLKEAYSKGALAAIGGVTSGEAKEMVPVADSYESLLLSPSASSPELTGISRNFFRIWPSDQTEAAKMAQSAITDLGVKTIVVVAEEQQYARGAQLAFRPAYEAQGGKILEVLEYPPNTSDMSGLASRVVLLQPEAVYLVDYADGVASMIQELRKQKFSGKILTTAAFSTPSAIARIGKDAAGVMLTQTSFDPGSDHVHIRKFVDAYKAKYGELPDIYAAHGYDAMMVLSVAMKGREPFSTEIRKGMKSDATKEYPGVTGLIEFDERGDVKKFPRLYMISSDLMPIDYNDEVRAKQREIEQRMRELQEKLARGGA